MAERRGITSIQSINCAHELRTLRLALDLEGVARGDEAERERVDAGACRVSLSETRQNLSVELDFDENFRLPSMKELQTLIDETRTASAIDPDVFPGASSSGYWSSTLVGDDAMAGWFVRFSDGYSLYSDLETPNFARCVR